MKNIILICSLFVLANASNNTAKALTNDICSKCHSMAIVIVHKGDDKFWKKVVVSMYKRGLKPLDKSTEDKIVTYLATEMKVDNEQKVFRRKPLFLK